MSVEEIAKEYEIDIEELKKAEIELHQKYAQLPNIEAIRGTSEEAFIKKGLVVYAKRIKRNSAESLFGYILTFQAPQMSNNKKINEAIKAYKIDPEAAIKAGYVCEIKEVNGNFHSRKLLKTGVVGTKIETVLPSNAINTGDTYIVPLDNNKTFFGGKANWKYLTALEPEASFSGIGGYIIADGEQHKFTMPLNLQGKDFKVPMNCPVQFNATVKEIKKDGSYLLAFKNNVTKFEEVPGDIDAFKDQIVKFSPISSIADIETIHKSKFGDPITVVGTVTDIWMGKPTDEKPNPSNTIYIEDMSVDTPMKVNMHPGLPINYAIDSIVVLWARTGKGDKWDKETKQTIKGETEYTLWATGSYPLVRSGPKESPKPVTATGNKDTEWVEET